MVAEEHDDASSDNVKARSVLSKGSSKSFVCEPSFGGGVTFHLHDVFLLVMVI